MPKQIKGCMNLEDLEELQKFCTCLMSLESIWFKHRRITRERRLAFQPYLHNPDTGSHVICFCPPTLLPSEPTRGVSPFDFYINHYRLFITCLPGSSEIRLPLRTYAHRAGQSPKKGQDLVKGKFLLWPSFFFPGAFSQLWWFCCSHSYLRTS